MPGDRTRTPLPLRASDSRRAIELRVLDWHARIRGRLAPPANISIVAIDETSLELVGRWPWPRTRTAEIVQRLTEGGARVIALDLLLREPDENSRLVLARSLADRYRELGLARAPGAAASFGKLLEEALSDADTDETLAHALAATRRVVLPYFFVFPPHESPPLDEESQRLLNRSRVVGFATPEAEQAVDPRRAVSVQLPLARFVTASAGNGHVNVNPDADGALRRIELVIRFGDGLYPSMTLETARLALGLSRTRVRLTADRGVQIGQTVVPTDASGVLHLSYYGPAGTFRTIPAVDILTGGAAERQGPRRPRGLHGTRLMDVRPTPFDSVMPGVESHATGLANLMEGRGLRQLAGMEIVETIAVLLLALAGPLLLPRVGPLWGTAVALGLAAGTTGLVHLGFRNGAWVLLLPPLVALAVGHVGSVTYQVLTEERERRWIKQAFRQYVPPAVVEELGRDPGKLTFGGERRIAVGALLGHPRVHDLLGAPSPGRGRGGAPGVPDGSRRGRVPPPRNFGQVHRRCYHGVLRRPLRQPGSRTPGMRAAVEMSDVVARLNERWKAEGREPFVTGSASPRERCWWGTSVRHSGSRTRSSGTR